MRCAVIEPISAYSVLRLASMLNLLKMLPNLVYSITVRDANTGYALAIILVSRFFFVKPVQFLL